MLKMIIRLNEDKIKNENIYRLDGIYKAIHSAFAQMDFSRVYDGTDAMIYHDNGDSKDFAKFGRIVNTLKKKDWFLDNVLVWLLCDSDDSENPDDFSEEDLLSYYKQKRSGVA